MATDIEIGPALPAERDAVRALLRDAGLPLDGLDAHFDEAIVARAGGRVVGSAALEIYSDGALLRSVAVDPALRGSGLGGRLTEALISRAGQRGIPALFLLTTTAAGFFPRFGFEPIERDAVPASVRESIEFRSACPASAAVMRRTLTLRLADPR